MYTFKVFIFVGIFNIDFNFSIILNLKFRTNNSVLA